MHINSVYNKNETHFNTQKINLLDYTSWIKHKIHMIISCEHLTKFKMFYDKKSQQIRDRKEPPQTDKEHVWKSFSWHPEGESPNISSLKCLFALTTSLQYHTGGPSQHNGQERKSHADWKGGNKIVLSAEDMSFSKKF